MPTRREMIETVLAFSKWPSLRRIAATPLPQTANAASADDEAFWAQVRSQFELVPEVAHLVSVVRGKFTKANREISFNEATRLNQGAAPLPDSDQQREIRKEAAGFIGAPTEHIALLRNTTEGVTTVLANWTLQAGDETLTSSAEHGPFCDALARRAARDHVVVRQFHYPAPVTSAESIVEAIDCALTPRTRLVMIGHVVLIGQINPVRQIADLIHSKGAKLLVDGVLGLGHIPVDVKARNCDFYAAGFHKFACGPRATAVFYVRPELVAQLPRRQSARYLANGVSAMPERNHTPGSLAFRKRLRGSCSSPIRRRLLPLLMLIGWLMLSKPPRKLPDRRGTHTTARAVWVKREGWIS